MAGEDEDEPAKALWPKLLAALLLLAVLAIALFYIGVYFCPDILDKFLYDEKELELLNYFGLGR